MTLQQEREWWEERVKSPFVGDMQQKLDAFQEKLIAAGEEPIHIYPEQSESLFKTLFGFDLL